MVKDGLLVQVSRISAVPAFGSFHALQLGLYVGPKGQVWLAKGQLFQARRERTPIRGPLLAMTLKLTHYRVEWGWVKLSTKNSAIYIGKNDPKN
jgi:hypothetical protein